MNPLVLGIRRSVTPAAALRKAHNNVTLKDWPQLRDAVLQRDNFTCHYCGFKAQKFQRVHFKNGAPTELHEDNLATACIFCEQCCELESVAKMHSGLLVWLPELDQTALHHFCRGLYVARMADGAITKTAQRIMDQILARRTEARKRLGTDEPHTLATAMIEHMNDATYSKRAEKLDGIRLLPLPRRLQNGDPANDQFPTIISYWASMQGPYIGGTPAEWGKYAEKLDGQVDR